MTPQDGSAGHDDAADSANDAADSANDAADSANGAADSANGDAIDPADDLEDVVDELIDRVLEGADALADHAESAARDEIPDDEAGHGARDSVDDVQAFVDDIVDVGEEAAAFLEEVDVEDVPAAVDLSALDDAVDPADVPEAVAEREPAEAIDLRALRKLVELGELWREVDVREAWRNAEELEDEVDDVIGTEAFDENEVADADRVDGDVSDHGLAGDPPSEAVAAKLGAEVRDAVEEIRSGLLDTHEEFARLRDENESRTDSAGQPTSRNPSAFSTMAVVGRDRPGPPRMSTVPRETRYSRTPNFDRIYGDRFSEVDDE